MMSVEVQWTDTDPDSGARRFVFVDRFAGQWRFHVRQRRREDWQTPGRVTLDMWEELREALDRRRQRGEGVTDADMAALDRRIAVLRSSEGRMQNLNHE
jgi:hypothetical protein